MRAAPKQQGAESYREHALSCRKRSARQNGNALNRPIAEITENPFYGIVSGRSLLATTRARSATGDVVSREDTARGYEVAKGQYLIVEDQEIDAVQIESTRTIEIDRFVPRSEIDDRYIDSPYYLAPDGKVGQDAFAVIRDTIAKMNMVAIGRVVLTRREHIIALESRGRGLLGLTLRYPYEVRDEQPYFEDIPDLKLPKEMLDLATHIV